MTSVQIRISLPVDDAVKLIDDYIVRCDKVLAFEHEADEDVSRTHSHFYLFALPLRRPDDAVRDHLRKHLGKTEYMVGLTAGKAKRELTPEKAYQYGTTSSLLVPRITKGFDTEEIKDFAADAAKFYAPRHERVLIIHETEQKPDNVWTYFYEKMLRSDPDIQTWDVPKFKKWIMADYLNRCKPIPRSADLTRYAFSLWMLRKHNDKKDNTEILAEDIPLYML